MKTLYEIWRIEGKQELPVKDYLGFCFHGFYRDDVVSLSLERLQYTRDRLQAGYGCDDIIFEIKELIDGNYRI